MQRYIDACNRNVVLLTGAGISVDSGIPDYRGSKGSYYTNHKPLTHGEYVGDVALRKRYWARSLVGFDRFAQAQPNDAHHAFVKLQRQNIINVCITQNVDALHQSAGMEKTINLHGCGHDMVCLSCGHKTKRVDYHKRLRDANPAFMEKLDIFANSKASALRPDGDADLHGVDVSALEVVGCGECADGMLKPDVVFFGAQVEKDVVERCYEACEQAEGMIVAGSSLTVYSSFRFVKKMLDSGKKILVVNVGETRADKHENVIKIEGNVSDVFRRLCELQP